MFFSEELCPSHFIIGNSFKLIPLIHIIFYIIDNDLFYLYEKGRFHSKIILNLKKPNSKRLRCNLLFLYLRHTIRFNRMKCYKQINSKLKTGTKTWRGWRLHSSRTWTVLWILKIINIIVQREIFMRMWRYTTILTVTVARYSSVDESHQNVNN